MNPGKTRKKRNSHLSFPWKRLMKSALIVGLLALSIFSVNQIKKNHQFPIHNVKVYGARHVNHQEVQHVMTQFVSNGFFAVEVNAIRDQLLQLSWVADASVLRVWPDKIIVVLTERVPIARWNENGLLSTNGEIFNPDANTYPTSLPQFFGPDGGQIQMLNYYTKITKVIQPLHSKITQLELTPYLAWNMTFDNGIKVNLGFKDVLTRINHFVKVYPKIVGARAEDVEYIDLRYTNGLAVKWKSVT